MVSAGMAVTTKIERRRPRRAGSTDRVAGRGERGFVELHVSGRLGK